MQYEKDLKQSDILQTTPVGRLFISMTIPVVLSMLIVGIYNIVDAFFISRFVSEEAMGAVAMVFPWQLSLGALAIMISTGMATLIGRKLGEGDKLGTGRILGSAVQLALIFGVMLTVLGLVLQNNILTWLSVPPLFWQSSLEYFIPITAGCSAGFLFSVFADRCRAEGRLALMIQLILGGAVLNILFDYLFIAQFQWDVAGAAYATILAQVLMVCWALWLLRSSELTVDWCWSPKVVGRILALGAPILMAEFSLVIQTGALNTLLLNYGNEYWVMAYGVLGRIAISIMLPMIAMAIVFQTICSHNIAAGNHHRVVQLIQCTLTSMVFYGVFTTIALFLGAKTIMELFTDELLVIDYGIRLIRYMIWGLPVVGFTIVLTGFYQAKAEALRSLLVSSLRVIFVMLPLLWLLPQLFSLNGVFIAIVSADYIASFLALSLFWRHYQNHTKAMLNTGQILEPAG